MEYRLRVEKLAALSFVLVADLVPVYESLATTGCLSCWRTRAPTLWHNMAWAICRRTNNGPHIPTLHVESPGTQFYWINPDNEQFRGISPQFNAVVWHHWCRAGILTDTVEESPQSTSPITKHIQRHSQRLNVLTVPRRGKGMKETINSPLSSQGQERIDSFVESH